MKVTKWVEFEKEVQIEITAEDIVAAISEDPNFKATVLRGFGNFYRFYQSVPLQVLAEFEPQQREILRKFFAEIVERLQPEGA